MQDENPTNQPTEQPVAATPDQSPAANQTPVAPVPTESLPTATSEPNLSSDEANTVTPKPKKKESGIFSFVITLLVAFVLVQIINMFLFQSYKVFGSSMYSTLHDGDRLIISKVGRTEAKVQGKHFVPKRGEIIVFIDPQNPNLQLIKRVIGLPGERVVVKDGKITIYNKDRPEGFNPDDAPYGKNLPFTSGDKDTLVPANHIFVSGDNREGSNSLDSRNELGTVPEDNIVGILKVRLYPFNTAKFF